MTKKLILFAAGLVLVWGAMVAGYAIGQRGLIYNPDKTRPDPVASGAEDMTVIDTRTEDGVALSGWFAPSGEDQDAPILLVFHGNKGNIGSRVRLAKPFIAQGWGVLLAEYRGFGGNGGKPTENGLYADGEAWFQWLVDKGYAPDRIIVYGESLGSGVATEIAHRHPEIRALVLQSGFGALADIGRIHYPYLPVAPLLLDRFDNVSKLPSSSVPILILQGANDRLVPPAQGGEALYAAANEPKKLVIFEDAAHSDLDPQRITKEISQFLKSLPIPAPAPAPAPTAPAPTAPAPVKPEDSAKPAESAPPPSSLPSPAAAPAP